MAGESESKPPPAKEQQKLGIRRAIEMPKIRSLVLVVC